MCLNSPSHGLALKKRVCESFPQSGCKITHFIWNMQIFWKKISKIMPLSLKKQKIFLVFLLILYKICIFALVIGKHINKSFKNIRE